MKKFLKWFAIIAGSVLLMAVLRFYFSFWGNPVSKILCKNTAEKYVAENYPNCYVEKRGYNFKDGNYFANIQCETSPDTNFFIYTDGLGNFRHDSYESYVASGHNTLNRLMMEYRALLDAAIPQEDVDYTLDIYFGDILTEGNYEKYSHDAADMELIGMPAEEVILDKEYDFTDISYKYGYVCLYVNDEDVSVDRACEILLDVKDRLNKANIGFYYIDFVLQLPRQEDGMPNKDDRQINIRYFRWDDIYEAGLADRVLSAHDRLTAYYAQLDAEWQKAFEDRQKESSNQ